MILAIVTGHFPEVLEGVYDPVTLSLTGIALVLEIAAVILWLIYVLKYFLVPFLLADDRRRRAGQLFADSCFFMQGKQAELFMALLSLCPWFLFSLLAIPMLYVFPYTGTILGIYANCYVEQAGAYERWQQAMHRQDPPPGAGQR